MVGIATFTIVASIEEISRLRQHVTSTMVLRRVLGGSTVVNTQ
jgi:hypothetical protein